MQRISMKSVHAEKSSRWARGVHDNQLDGCAVGIRTKLPAVPPIAIPRTPRTPWASSRYGLRNTKPIGRTKSHWRCVELQRLPSAAYSLSCIRRGYRLVGDVNFEQASGKASYITPVPGGVGPMTIAMLLRNTVDGAAKAFQG